MRTSTPPTAESATPHAIDATAADAAAPAISVILPVHNGGAFLAEAVDSVLAQTERDFELIVIDDASSDPSVELLERYRDPRIRLIRQQPNRGQAATLNHGLALARGRYVARLDQDDACLPERFARQRAWLDARPDVAVVGTWACCITPSGRRTGLVGLRRLDEFGSYLGALLSFVSPLPHPTVMFRRDAVRALGGYRPEEAPCEDYGLWCRLARQGGRATLLPEPLTLLRLHAGQQSARQAAPQRAQAARVHQSLVAALADPADAEAVGAVLRLESLDDARAIETGLAGLETLLARAADRFGLTPIERARLRRRVSWWLAHGACLGLLEQRWPAVRLWRHAWRGGPSLLLTRPMLLFPAVALVSPLCVPAVRARVAAWTQRAGRLRDGLRLWTRPPRASPTRPAAPHP